MARKKKVVLTPEEELKGGKLMKAKVVIISLIVGAVTAIAYMISRTKHPVRCPAVYHIGIYRVVAVFYPYWSKMCPATIC